MATATCTALAQHLPAQQLVPCLGTHTDPPVSWFWGHTLFPHQYWWLRPPPTHTHTPAAATAALGHLHPIQLQQLAPNPPMPVAPVAGTWSLALAHSGQTLWLCRFNNLKDLIRRQDRLQQSRAELTQASALASPVVHAAGPFYILFCLLLDFSLQLPH